MVHKIWFECSMHNISASDSLLETDPQAHNDWAREGKMNEPREILRGNKGGEDETKPNNLRKTNSDVMKYESLRATHLLCESNMH